MNESTHMFNKKYMKTAWTDLHSSSREKKLKVQKKYHKLKNNKLSASVSRSSQLLKSSQFNTLPQAKSQSKDKRAKDRQ